MGSVFLFAPCSGEGDADSSGTGLDTGRGSCINGEGDTGDTKVSELSVVKGVADMDTIGAGLDEDWGTICKESIVFLEFEEFLWKFPKKD